MKNTELKGDLIHHILENSAKRFPNKTALVHDAIRVSYSDINKDANRMAHFLIDSGVVKNDRVILIFENCLEYVTTYYGILKTGAIAVSLSTDLKPDGLSVLVEEIEPKVIIASSRFEKLLHGSKINVPYLETVIVKSPKLNWTKYDFNFVVFETIAKTHDIKNPDHCFKNSTRASIVYTSGSTGKPKGVILTHKNIVTNTNSICQYLELTENDIQMVVLPFFYVMGKSLLNTHFAVGGRVIINNKFAFPASVLNQMVEEQVTGFSGVPSTFAHLLHRSPLKKYRDKLRSLRYCSQAGGHMSNEIKTELGRILPDHTKLFIMYGASEASARLTYLSPELIRQRMGSIGKPIPGVTIMVLDRFGNKMPAGKEGELVASGDNIMEGYWEDPKATQDVLDTRGYHTGDFGYQDSDGFLYVNGRKDDLVKVGGHRINPMELENALMETGLVMETSVVGLPDTLLGTQLNALVVTKNGSSNENEIMQKCSQTLPKYKLPSHIYLTRILPKNSNGKINRVKCQEMIRKLIRKDNG